MTRFCISWLSEVSQSFYVSEFWPTNSSRSSRKREKAGPQGHDHDLHRREQSGVPPGNQEETDALKVLASTKTAAVCVEAVI